MLPADSFKISGPQLGRNFVIDFTGPPIVATRRASKCLQSLRKPSGEWLESWLESPIGRPTKLFIGPDQSPATRATIGLGKRKLFIAQRKGAAGRMEPS